MPNQKQSSIKSTVLTPSLPSTTFVNNNNGNSSNGNGYGNGHSGVSMSNNGNAIINSNSNGNGNGNCNGNVNENNGNNQFTLYYLNNTKNMKSSQLLSNKSKTNLNSNSNSNSNYDLTPKLGSPTNHENHNQNRSNNIRQHHYNLAHKNTNSYLYEIMTDNNLAMNTANGNGNSIVGNFTLPMVKKYHNMVFIMKKIYDITANCHKQSMGSVGKIEKKGCVGKGRSHKNKENQKKQENKQKNNKHKAIFGNDDDHNSGNDNEEQLHTDTMHKEDQIFQNKQPYLINKFMRSRRLMVTTSIGNEQQLNIRNINSKINSNSRLNSNIKSKLKSRRGFQSVTEPELLQISKICQKNHKIVNYFQKTVISDNMFNPFSPQNLKMNSIKNRNKIDCIQDQYFNSFL